MSDADAEHDWIVTLDGSRVQVRRIETDDYDAVIQLAMSLTDRERYLRFFTTHPNYLAEWGRALTASSDRGHCAVGAFEDDTLVGIANYVATTSTGCAEVSVVVAHEQHDRGVATILLTFLGMIARNNGIHHLVADVLTENQSMRKVVIDAGWPCTRYRDGYVTHIDVDLDQLGSGESAR